MDILSLLEEVQNESLILRHPLAEEDISITFAYAVGVGIIAAATGTLSASGKAGLEKLAAELNLPELQISKIPELVVAPDKTMIKSIVDAVNQLNWQYFFLLDAHKVAAENGGSGEKYKQAMLSFLTMFKLTQKQKQVWANLADKIFADDFEKSEITLQEIYDKEFNLIYRALVYYLPEQCNLAKEKLTKEILEQKNKLEHSRSQLEHAKSQIGIKSELSKWYQPMTWGQAVEGKAKEKERGIEFDKQQATLQTIELLINQLEHKEKALNLALDSMYLSS